MRTHLIPVLFLLVLPALYFAHHSRWLRKRLARDRSARERLTRDRSARERLTRNRLTRDRLTRDRWALERWARGIGAAALAAAVVWSLPWQGLDFLLVKRINLLIAAATALLFLLRHYRVPWACRRPRRLAVLTAIAAIAIVNYFNYFAFRGHGQRAFVHLHDVAHYYLGSKYYAELGYTDLYTAMLRAEAELYNDRFKAIEARDLATYELVHIRALLERSEPVKAAFSAERWHDFRLDVATFRDRLDRHYGKVLLDHGFNPTPVWALFGGALAGRVPVGSQRGILLLTLLDPLLLILAFAAVRWAFGLEATLLAVIHFCVIFGATFGWTGGAFGRHVWFFAVVAAFACLHRRRHLAAGALLALATMLRVFPAFFLAPLAFKAAAALWRRRAVSLRHLPRRYRRLFASFAATASLLFALTAFLPRGLHHWSEFRVNMQQHVATISSNVVGLTEALARRWGEEDKVTAEELAALKVRRQHIYRLQLAVVLLPLLLLAARLAPRRTDLGAAALGLPLLYAGLSLAAYYYAFLIVLLLAHRAAPGRIALIFAAEAACYTLMLFEDRDAVLFIYRGLLLALLYLAVCPRYRTTAGGVGLDREAEA